MSKNEKHFLFRYAVNNKVASVSSKLGNAWFNLAASGQGETSEPRL